MKYLHLNLLLISVVGSEHKKYANHVKLSISIPHRDGMLPTISTEKLTNFEYMLSPSASRVGLHRYCCQHIVALCPLYRLNLKALLLVFFLHSSKNIRTMIAY